MCPIVCVLCVCERVRFEAPEIQTTNLKIGIFHWNLYEQFFFSSFPRLCSFAQLTYSKFQTISFMSPSIYSYLTIKSQIVFKLVVIVFIIIVINQIIIASFLSLSLSIHCVNKLFYGLEYTWTKQKYVSPKWIHSLTRISCQFIWFVWITTIAHTHIID